MKPSGAVKIPIAAKFLLLVLSALCASVLGLLFNATSMYKKDSLNNIYLASDLLTAAKAGEVRFWLEGLLKKGEAIGAALNSGPSVRERLGSDRDVIFAQLCELRGAGADDPECKSYFYNPALGADLRLTEAEFAGMRKAVPIHFAKVGAGATELLSMSLPLGNPILVLNMPYHLGPDGNAAFVVSLGVRPDELSVSFSDNGPYSLSLVNDRGQILLPAEPRRRAPASLSPENPLVQRMLVSRLDREFHEFAEGKTAVLGAFAKVKLAGLGVLSQVPRSVAFEPSNALVRRSVLIAMMILSGVFILAYFFVETIVSPIRQLSLAAGRISEGKFDIRVDVRSLDEMNELATSFNLMSAEIGRKIHNLSRINEASNTISSTLDPQRLIEFSTDTLMSLLGCGRALAWFDGANGARTVTRNWFEPQDFSLPRLMGLVSGEQKPFRLAVGGEELLFAPIREKSLICGYIVLGGRESGRQFEDEDLFTAGTVLTNVGTTFENIRLLKETADKARMEKELETAKHVQDTMFPPASIQAGLLDVQSYYTPAEECGGDWWGCAELPDGKVILAIGDATGHGVPAAMITATAKASCSIIQQLARSSPTLASSPRIMLNLLNKAVFDATQGKILMTFFFAIVDNRTGEVVYATASHDPIYRYKMPKDAAPGQPGEKANLDVLAVEPGPRLGEGPQATYAQGKVRMGRGDFLVLYTDGLPEGKDPAQQEYGERKFLRSIARNAHRNASEIRDGLLADFRAHIQGERLHDDVTLAICQFGVIPRKS